MDPILLRMLERIIVVIIGGISVYLGYLLFLKLPNQQDSNGKIVLPGGISIFVSRVGPGVFFMIFGVAVVCMSLYMSVSYEQRGEIVEAQEVTPSQDTDPQSPPVVPAIVFSGVGPYNDFTPDDLETERLNIRSRIETINNLNAELRPDIEPQRASKIKIAVPFIKRVMMNAVWYDEEWGDNAEFQEWLDRGEQDDYSEGIANAVEFYRFGEGRNAP